MERKDIGWYRRMSKSGTFIAAYYHAITKEVADKTKSKKGETVTDIVTRLNDVGFKRMTKEDKEMLDMYNWTVEA
jgi:hypothetical protein